MQLYLGSYEVVERKDQLGSFAIHLGGHVYINIHVLGLPARMKAGDKLPLFTKVPYDPKPLDAVLRKPAA